MFSFPHLVVAATIFSSPNDVTAVHNAMKTFSCTFNGSTAPSWKVTNTAGTLVQSVQHNSMISFFNYPRITAILNTGTVSTLQVRADQSLNGTKYRCIISALPNDIESEPATLTVYGKY